MFHISSCKCPLSGSSGQIFVEILATVARILAPRSWTSDRLTLWGIQVRVPHDLQQLADYARIIVRPSCNLFEAARLQSFRLPILSPSEPRSLMRSHAFSAWRHRTVTDNEDNHISEPDADSEYFGNHSIILPPGPFVFGVSHIPR